MGESKLLDILIFAMIAGFIFLRLRGVLGRRTGQEKPPPDLKSQPRDESGDEKIVQLPDRGARDIETDDSGRAGDDPGAATLSAGFAQIRISDRSFDESSFVEGARVAYEMIVTSFANSDIDTLRPLVADEVYQNFASAIDTREERGETVETTILSIKSADIIEAGVAGSIAEITVKFVTEMVSVTRNSDGEVIAGDTRAVQDITDIWTFARSTKSSDPNWTLIETRSPN
ncbi:MAG: Tim44/TimA family putative adaptor protein [Proteobacteria bacterium]|nr:Tim44/TimA family putative adaptor protein [Pseudomonadota bacterium]